MTHSPTDPSPSPDMAIVVGATLTCLGTSESGIVVHVDPGGRTAWLKLPYKPFPYIGGIGSSETPTFLPYHDQTTWCRDPTAPPVPVVSNCPTLRPGDLTNLGRVLWVSHNSVRLSAYGLHADYPYLETYSSGTFIDLHGSMPPVTVSTPASGFSSPPAVGELWTTLLGQYVAITGPEAGVVIPQPDTHSGTAVRAFWSEQYQGTRATIPVQCQANSAAYFPRAMTAEHLLVRQVSRAGFWYLQSSPEAPVDIVTAGFLVRATNWQGLPLSRHLLPDSSAVPSVYPELPNYEASLSPEPDQEDDEDTITCDICRDECQESGTISLRLFQGSTRSSGAAACPSCQNNSTLCPDCSRRFITLDSDGGVIESSRCPSCQVLADSELPTVYRAYAYHPEPKFLGAGPLYFGVELELWTDSQKSMKLMAMEVQEKAAPVIYSKTDSSIGDHGLEFVTHPFTMDSLDARDALETLFTLVDKPNWKAKDTCGIHIHTSKLGYKILESSLPSDRTGDLTDAQLLTRGLFRAQRFVYGNPDLITYFAGRNSETYASLEIRPGGDRERNGDDGHTGFEDALRLCREHRANKPNRYAAMNFTKDTVEYRVFKSTKHYAELLRNLHFIESIVQYARHHAMPKTRAPSLKPYREFLETQTSWDDVRKFFDAGLGAKFN